MKYIQLTKGFKSLVDDEDYDFLNQYSWHVTSGGYAQTNIKDGVRFKSVKMHRLLLKPSSNLEIDHINRNKLDNRRVNLRIVNHQQNMCNTTARSNSTSKFRGVSWIKRERKWVAQLGFKGKRIHIGYFDNQVSAAKAFNIKAIKLFGKLARLNPV